MQTMNQLYGLGVTALSVLVAALVSWARLKPYVDAGEKYTPMSFAVYPALTAAAIAIPVVFLLRKWQGKKALEIGPIAFPGEFAFVAFGCWVYVIVAVVFFPYTPPMRPTPENPYRPAVREVALPSAISSQQNEGASCVFVGAGLVPARSWATTRVAPTMTHETEPLPSKIIAFYSC